MGVMTAMIRIFRGLLMGKRLELEWGLYSMGVEAGAGLCVECGDNTQLIFSVIVRR